MITDPRTVVRGRGGQILVAVLVAAAEALVRALGDLEVRAAEPLLRAPPIFALAIVGPAARFLDLLVRYDPDPRPGGPGCG